MRFLNSYFRTSIINSIVMAILGILLLFESEVTIISISYIIGAVLIGIGAVAIIKYVRLLNSPLKNVMDLVYGFVTIILGAIVINNPRAIASIIPIVVGVIIIVSSASKLQYSLELKNDKNDIWKSTLIISLVTMICGVLLVFNPFEGAEFLAKLIGVLILLYAVLDLVSTVSIKKTVKNVHKAIEEGITEATIIETKEKKKSKKENKEEE